MKSSCPFPRCTYIAIRSSSSARCGSTCCCRMCESRAVKPPSSFDPVDTFSWYQSHLPTLVVILHSISGGSTYSAEVRRSFPAPVRPERREPIVMEDLSDCLIIREPPVGPIAERPLGFMADNDVFSSLPCNCIHLADASSRTLAPVIRWSRMDWLSLLTLTASCPIKTMHQP
jgi:hypothetical protein